MRITKKLVEKKLEELKIKWYGNNNTFNIYVAPNKVKEFKNPADTYFFLMGVEFARSQLHNDILVGDKLYEYTGTKIIKYTVRGILIEIDKVIIQLYSILNKDEVYLSEITPRDIGKHLFKTKEEALKGGKI